VWKLPIRRTSGDGIAILGLMEADASLITLDTFERCAIPLEQFNHRAHITVACLYLKAFPLSEAIDRMRRGIHAFNAANNVQSTQTSGYHETMTVAWMRILDAVMRTHGAGQSVEEFLEQHPFLLCRTLLRLYYSRDRIMSLEARRTWVEPDLAPLPVSIPPSSPAQTP
jgi:hypothetical protein